MQRGDLVLELDTAPESELLAVPQRARSVVGKALQAMRRMQGAGLFPREHQIRERSETIYELRTYGYPQPITEQQLEHIKAVTNATAVYMMLGAVGNQLQARGALVVHIKVPPVEHKKRSADNDDNDDDEDEYGDDNDEALALTVRKRRSKHDTDGKNNDDQTPGWLTRLFDPR